ncbi:hypothetical protein STEG23_032488 [Scotinomys teguina]
MWDTNGKTKSEKNVNRGRRRNPAQRPGKYFDKIIEENFPNLKKKTLIKEGTLQAPEEKSRHQPNYLTFALQSVLTEKYAKTTVVHKLWELPKNMLTCKIDTNFHLFTFGHAVFPASLLEGFVFPYEVESCSFQVCEELCWDFDGDCIESVDCFWQSKSERKKRGREYELGG